MSGILDKYRNQVHVLLSRARDNAVQDLQNGASYRRAVHGGQFTPAATCEEIAMTAVQAAARIKAFDEALFILEDTYKRLFEKDAHE